MSLLDNVDVVILAGGLGTRLRSIVSDRPKSLIEINGKPFIFYILDQLSHTTIPRLVFCLGYKGYMVEETIGQFYKNIRVDYSYECTPLGTGGALRNAMELIKTKFLIVMNGDSFLDINYEDFLCWHQHKGACVSMALTEISSSERYGNVIVNSNDEIIEFNEKTENNNGSDLLINAGIYIINRSVFDQLPTESPFSLENNFFSLLVGKQFFGYQTKGNFIDIGTPDSLATSKQFFTRLLADRDLVKNQIS